MPKVVNKICILKINIQTLYIFNLLNRIRLITNNIYAKRVEQILIEKFD